MQLIGLNTVYFVVSWREALTSEIKNFPELGIGKKIV
jgi:hypothetical protein